MIIVYCALCFIHVLMLDFIADLHITDWQWWVLQFIPILTFVCGREVESRRKD